MGIKDEHFDQVVKLLLLGDSAVGKTSLLLRYCEDKFETSFVLTIGVDFKTKILDIGGKRVKLQIWDTAGQERFRTITPAYFRNAGAVVMVYDVTNAATFEHLQYWMNFITEYCETDIQKVLIGNKVDLKSKREVTTKRGQEYAMATDMPYFETSAKQNTGVEEAFWFVATTARYTQSVQPQIEEEHKINTLDTHKSTEGKRCCGH